MTNTFVFRLENGYYYIGTSDNVIVSFHELMKTLPNKPIGIERIIENGSTMDDLICLTKAYYETYGKDKVRSPIMIDWVTPDQLENSRRKSLLMHNFNYGDTNKNSGTNITVLDYMISLKNSNILCGRRCSCINRLCPHAANDSD